MAKMFYTMEETKNALSRSEDEIKQLVREGKLREFRDGMKLMFKTDAVEALKGSLPPVDRLDVGGESGAPIGLVDSSSSSGISMADSKPSDIGLSGSKSGSRSGSAVFDPRELDLSDGGQSSASRIGDSLSGSGLDPVGSGSGLLDLSKSGDDTSLGSQLSGSLGASAAGQSGAAAALESSSPRQVSVAPMVVERPDSTAPFFGGMAIGAAALALVGLFAVISAAMGAQSPLIAKLQYGPLLLAGAGLVVTLIFGAIGMALGKVLK